MKIVTIVGARPQFVKASAVSRALTSAGVTEVIVHTGQHFDFEMSEVFFRDLGIPAPLHNLGVAGGGHGAMTGQMMEKLEVVFFQEEPDIVLVYGDTNSTLAAALAAVKLRIPVAHVEAGLRSNNRGMPEEINRIVTDHVSSWLYCSSEVGERQLADEGITAGVSVVGDVMADVFFRTVELLGGQQCVSACPNSFDLLTIHRADTASNPAILKCVLGAIGQSCKSVLFPAHPRTRNLIDSENISVPSNIKMIEPVGYQEMVRLLMRCERVITDSGGLQKEAYWAQKPCITLRTETEWVETVEAGWNQVVGVDCAAIRGALSTVMAPGAHPVLYGDGHAAERIVENLVEGTSANHPTTVALV